MTDPVIHCLKDKMVSVEELKPHPKNRNKHPEDQIKRLAEILKYQGFRYPVKVSKRSGFVTSGHGRIEAARLNGWKKVPVNFQEYASDEQEYADVQADNAIASWAELDLSGINSDLGDLGPDFNLDMLGLKNFTLEPAEKLAPGCDEDEVPEHVEPRTRRGDIYQLGRHRLMCGDSTSIDDVEKLTAGEKADMVFTDPPYGIAHSGKGIEGSTGGNDFGSILGDEDVTVAIDAFNLSKGLLPDATLIFWGANYYCSSLPNGFGWLVWDKQREGNTFSGAELAYVNRGVRLDVFRHMWHGMIKASEHGESRVHPTQKPIALPVWCFDNYGNPKTVLDLFGGSGSTLIACEKTQRQCFMMELDPHYCDVIVARWEKYTGKKAELVSG
jgi:hypothetical protein